MNRAVLAWSVCASVMGGALTGPAASVAQEATRTHLSARQLLQAGLGEEAASEPVKCGFPLITRALRDRASLAPDLSHALSSLMARPVMQTTRSSGSFRVHYDTTGSDAPALLDPTSDYQRIPGTHHAYADSVLSILSFVHLLETESLGYLPPPSDGTLGGGPECDVYVMNLTDVYGNQGYGETTPDVGVPNGGRATSWISIDNDFSFVTPAANKGLPALRVTVAHEYHHAIQVGSYGYWTTDVYFYELTSTWLEDVAYTDVNDYYNYLNASWGHFRNPGTVFASGSDLIMYSRSIWGIFVAKTYGSDVMRRCWELIADMPPVDAIDAALKERSSSFAEAYSLWTIWNYHTAERSDPVQFYPEGGNYPKVVQVRSDFTPPSRRIDGQLGPLAARYHQVFVPASPTTVADTVTLLLANVDVTGAAASIPAQPYSYLLADSKVDPSYVQAGLTLYAKLAVSEPQKWYPVSIRRDSIVSGRTLALEEGEAFPNPFFPDGSNGVLVPLTATAKVTGTMYVYDPSMGLVWKGDVQSSYQNGAEVVRWDGRTSRGEIASSGVYVYAIDLGTRVVTGKIAVVRR